MPRGPLTEEQKAQRRATRERNEKKRQEQAKIDRFAWDLKNLRDEYKLQTKFGEPTRRWNVGARVQFGNHENAEVVEVVDGMFYFVRSWGMKKQQHQEKYYPYENFYWEPWYRLEDEITLEERGEPFSYRDDVQIVYSNGGISGLLHRHYSGLDYEPEYQRGHVWTMEQRYALIESIFNNIDIGKFTFIHRGYANLEEPYYEVLDGKQRLTTIIMFYEDRFEYRGRVYSRMHGRDQSHFENYQALVAETDGATMTREQKLRYFLKLNTAGAPQDPKHVAKIKDLWINVREEYNR